MPVRTVALVQLDPGADKAANVEAAFERVEEAAARGADAVLLPESFHVRGPSALRFETSEPIPGPLSRRLAEAAGRLGITLVAGSYNEKLDRPDRLHNTGLVFGPDGSTLATYRKIHLFDAQFEGRFVARESSRNLPGDRAVTVDTEIGTLGVTICYDLRFPELFRTLALMGAEVFTVPSNFARHTGKDHWEPLLRARAIENGAYVLAPATCGDEGGFAAYGRSMVVDPWGTVIAQAPDGPGVILADLDLERVRAVRQQLPSLANRRPETYRL
jgi:predicted amidohydrolase